MSTGLTAWILSGDAIAPPEGTGALPPTLVLDFFLGDMAFEAASRI